MGDGFFTGQTTQPTESKHWRKSTCQGRKGSSNLLGQQFTIFIFIHYKGRKNETINSTKLNTKYLAAVHYHTVLLKIVKSVVQIAILWTMHREQWSAFVWTVVMIYSDLWAIFHFVLANMNSRSRLLYAVAHPCVCLYISNSDVISSYQLFSAILWGKLCEMFAILTSVDATFSIR